MDEVMIDGLALIIWRKLMSYVRYDQTHPGRAPKVWRQDLDQFVQYLFRFAESEDEECPHRVKDAQGNMSTYLRRDIERILQDFVAARIMSWYPMDDDTRALLEHRAAGGVDVSEIDKATHFFRINTAAMDEDGFWERWNSWRSNHTGLYNPIGLLGED